MFGIFSVRSERRFNFFDEIPIWKTEETIKWFEKAKWNLKNPKIIRFRNLYVVLKTFKLSGSSENASIDLLMTSYSDKKWKTGYPEIAQKAIERANVIGRNMHVILRLKVRSVEVEENVKLNYWIPRILSHLRGFELKNVSHLRKSTWSIFRA